MTDYENIDGDTYYDVEGNEVSLNTLCRMEPAWAANIIRTLRAEVAAKAKLMKFSEVSDSDTYRCLSCEKIERFADAYSYCQCRTEETE
jgi:hypothetical protein